jgi:hypothetical protein
MENSDKSTTDFDFEAYDKSFDPAVMIMFVIFQKHLFEPQYSSCPYLIGMICIVCERYT